MRIVITKDDGSSVEYVTRDNRGECVLENSEAEAFVDGAAALMTMAESTLGELSEGFDASVLGWRMTFRGHFQ